MMPPLTPAHIVASQQREAARRAVADPLVRQYTRGLLTVDELIDELVVRLSQLSEPEDEPSFTIECHDPWCRECNPNLDDWEWHPNPCCQCCVAAAERGELDHEVGDHCPCLPCDWHQGVQP